MLRRQTPDSPSDLGQEEGLTPKTLLIFQDLDGKKKSAAGGNYSVSVTVAKLIIHDVADVSITVSRGVVSTLEVHNATNLKLRLEDQSQEQSRVPGSETSASYGTLTLDPHLDNVTVLFGKPSDIGAIILTKPSHAAPSRSLNNVTLGIDSEDTFSLLSSMENEDERNQLDGGQRHFFYDSGWKEKELVRKEKDYPSLVQ